MQIALIYNCCTGNYNAMTVYQRQLQTFWLSHRVGFTSPELVTSALPMAPGRAGKIV